MKNTLFDEGAIVFIALLCLPTISFPQTQNIHNSHSLNGKFTLKGVMTNLIEPVETIYLSYNEHGKVIKDSAKVKDGNYFFSGFLSEPAEATIEACSAKNNNRSSFYFFLDAGNITIASISRFDNYIVKGSRAEVESQKLNQLLRPVQDELKATLQKYSQASKNKEDTLVKVYQQRLAELSTQTIQISGEFVRKNPRSRLAVNSLELFSRIELSKNISKVEEIYSSLPVASKNTYTGHFILDRIKDERKTRIGEKLPPYTLKDTAGNFIRLSSYKGQYLLFDFWASWCKPCRAENPNLTNMYKKYKEKGFLIIGISLDEPADKQKWLAAISGDRLVWPQLSEYSNTNKKVSKELGVRAIPFNLLVNKEGKIIAKNLRGKNLEEVLKSYME